MSEKTLPKIGQKPLLGGTKRRPKIEKLAATVSGSPGQKKLSVPRLETRTKNTPYDTTSSK